MKIYARRKAPNPTLNIPRWNEPVAADTIYSHTPVVDNGSAAAQFFVGTESVVCDVYPLQSDKQFVNAFQDTIRKSSLTHECRKARADGQENRYRR